MFRRLTIEKKKTVGKRPKVKIVNLQQEKKKKGQKMFNHTNNLENEI